MHDYASAMAKHGIPDHMYDSIVNYIVHRIEPGGFLSAVICNNLKEACGRADHINKTKLFEYVSFFYNDAPSTCWGSPDKLKAWLNVGEPTNEGE